MSVLHQSQNANYPDRQRRRRILAFSILVCALIALAAGLLWPSPTDSTTSPTSTLTPYEPEPSDKLAHEASQESGNEHESETTKERVLAARPGKLPVRTLPSPDPPAPGLAPSRFFPEDNPEPERIPLSEPMADAPPKPIPFEPEALQNQRAELGPRQWMAQLPDEESDLIQDTIEEATLKVANEIDAQERERMLHGHASHLVTSATLRCASHNLSARARVVVHIDLVSLTKAHGRLLGVSATANIPAGGRAMQRCLVDALEGRHFALSLDDTQLRHIDVITGQAR